MFGPTPSRSSLIARKRLACERGSIQETLDRVAALTKDWLERAQDEWPEGFEVKTLGVVLELDFDDGILVGYNCSDPRPWAQAGFFRRAMRGADTEEVEP